MAYEGGHLSEGAIQRMHDIEEVDSPILQVVDIKKIPVAQGKERYRLIISDSNHFIQSMLGTQMNEMMESQQVKNFTIIKLNEHVCNEVPGKNGSKTKIAIILNFEVVQHYDRMIGHPVNVERTIKEEPKANDQQQQQRQQQQQQQQYHQPSIPTQQHDSFSDDAPLVKIAKLNFYLSRWIIIARCSFVGKVREWSNERSSGRLLPIHFIDDSGEIKATLFNEVLDKFGPLFKEGNLYQIGKAKLRQAKKNYSTLKHDFELSIDTDTVIIPLSPSDPKAASIPHMHFSFLPIKSVGETAKDDMIDIIGVVHASQPLEIKKFGEREVFFRNLTVLDDTENKVSVAFWGENAEQLKDELLNTNPVISIKGCKVSDFNGRSLSTVSSSQIQMNPNLKKTKELRDWYDSKGSEFFESFNNLSNQGSSQNQSWKQKTIEEIVSEMGQRNGTDYCKIVGTILNIRKEQNFFYKSCLSENCRRKVREEDDGTYVCDHCQKTFSDYNRRYAFHISIADHTGVQRASVFDEAGKVILECDAKHIETLKEQDEHGLESLLEEVKYKHFSFNVSVSDGNYEGETTVDCKVSSAKKVDYVAETAELLSKIKLL